MVATEGCDDAVIGDEKGCKADCSGPMVGWLCENGTKAIGHTCIEVCGNGFITALENCEDGNTASGDGCSSICY